MPDSYPCPPGCPRLQPGRDPCRGQQRARCRFLSELNDWLTPPALHAVFTRLPAIDPDGNPITDPEFEQLAQWSPTAAENHLIPEAKAFFAELPARDRRRREEALDRAEHRVAVRAAGQRQATAYVRRRQAITSTTPTIPGL